MTDLRFEYDRGRAVAAVLDLDGPYDLRIGLAGLDATEVSRLKAAFGKASTLELQILNRMTRDGINADEKSLLVEKIQDAINGEKIRGESYSYRDGNSWVFVSTMPMLKVDDIKAEPSERGALNLTGINIDSNLISISGDGTRLRMNLTGLSAEEAEKLEQYINLHPEEANAFSKMMVDVAKDQKITPAERDLVNNETEQLLIRADVSSDVVPDSISAGPALPKLKR